MIRHKLKNGGATRKKALFGLDGAVTAGAILSAAGINATAQAAAAAMNANATSKAATTQAKSIEANAKTQADSIKAQTANNTELQQQSIDFTKQQNQELRDQQRDIQTTLQMLAGQQNSNEYQERNKMAVKYGGNKNSKRQKLAAQPFYGGASLPFQVTDGGGVIPLQVDNNGYGLYEIYGNDHDHYHKTASGKYKSGVGFKFNDGTIIEGEGNQNTTKGEKVLVTPNDAMFISKHSIKGFNPANAVDAGMNPVKAFMLQQQLKATNGINDDGSRQNFPHRESLISRTKANDGKYWNTYGGATINAAGNLLGAGITGIGNYFASKKLANAYNNAGNILANAYDSMTGIDTFAISKEDYAPSHAMATIRSINSNYNPQLERLRRNAVSEKESVNRSTLSSAARQQRLAGVNDRAYQRMGEVYATKYNADENIKQQNAKAITEVSKTNAYLDTEATKNYSTDKLSLLKYNNDINNAKIAGRAQSLADAATQAATVKSSAISNSTSALASAIGSTGQGFSTALTNKIKNDNEFTNTFVGLGDKQQVQAALLRYQMTGDDRFIQALLKRNTVSDDDRISLKKAIGLTE